MRFRSRTGTYPPYYNGSTPEYEEMTDDDSKSRGWKECGHIKTHVLEFIPGKVSIGSRRIAAPSTDWSFGPEIKAARYLPWGSFEHFLFSGFIRDSLVESAVPSFPKLSPSVIALEISRSSTNLAEALASIKQTAGMLAKPGKFLKHVQKQNIPLKRDAPIAELRASLDRAGQTWLEGTYGYLPLISDLIELSSIVRNPRKALEKLNKPIQKDKYDTYQGADTYQVNPDLGPNQARLAISSKIEASRLVRFTGTPNPSFQAMGIANQMATYLGLNDFGRLAWELTPYSFVIDWFTDMGKTLSSAAAANGHVAYVDLVFSSCHHTKRTTTHQIVAPTEATVDDPWYPGVYQYQCKVLGGVCTTEEITFSRTRPGEANLGDDLVWNGLNAYKTATGAALLLGRLGNISKW